MSLTEVTETKKDVYINRLMMSLDKKCYQSNIGNVSIKEAKRIIDKVDYKYNIFKRILMTRVDNLYKPNDVIDTGSHLDSKTADLLKIFKLKRKNTNGSIMFIHGPNSILNTICSRRLEHSYLGMDKPRFMSILDDYLSCNIDRLTIHNRRIILKPGGQVYLDSGSLRDYIYADHHYEYFNKFNKLLIERYKLSSINDLSVIRAGVINKNTKYFIYEFLTTTVFIGDGLVGLFLKGILNSMIYTNLEKEKMLMYNDNYLDLICITTRNALLPYYKINLEKILSICSEESRLLILESIKDMKII
jgi:hypothetical protein